MALVLRPTNQWRLIKHILIWQLVINTLKIQKNIKHAIILGNEVKGVSQKTINLSNDVIEISQFGTKHSLNVSTCSAILIWEFFNALT